ncbi:hypothetical protein BAU15_05390 [Enterococcus sp. JM4C]|uniref:hypothetical protein n=1 Tax=Candidatus Enterococcus huntleyi TaxID=1857217 RepID=UPI001379BEC0|nr:hypothetical protein [Enterococcus sp. JM4C]KAF1295187.1 hypothetical protein BAU15_05390 [Enterococcus sp. JM4C]
MARLIDYGIHVKDLKNAAEVTIRGQKFPIAFTMETMEYIADIYDDDYSKFEEETNRMLKSKGDRISSADLTAGDLKIMRSLVYAMLRTGGLEDSPEDIFIFLGMSQNIIDIYGVCMEIFSDQTFQVADIKKSKKPQDFKNSNQTQKRKNKNKHKKK